MTESDSGGARSVLFLFVRLAAGGVLAVFGYAKLLIPPEEFALSIETYQILPLNIIMPLSHVLPWAEVVVGICLVLGLFTRLSALGAGALYGMFVMAISSSYIRGLDLSNCGCFGRTHMEPSHVLVMDSIFAVLCLLLLWKGGGRFCLDNWRHPRKDSL